MLCRGIRGGPFETGGGGGGGGGGGWLWFSFSAQFPLWTRTRYSPPLGHETFHRFAELFTFFHVWWEQTFFALSAEQTKKQQKKHSPRGIPWPAPNTNLYNSRTPSFSYILIYPQRGVIRIGQLTLLWITTTTRTYLLYCDVRPWTGSVWISSGRRGTRGAEWTTWQAIYLTVQRPLNKAV